MLSRKNIWLELSLPFMVLQFYPLSEPLSIFAEHFLNFSKSINSKRLKKQICTFFLPELRRVSNKRKVVVVHVGLDLGDSKSYWRKVGGKRKKGAWHVRGCGCRGNHKASFWVGVTVLDGNTDARGAMSFLPGHRAGEAGIGFRSFMIYYYF